MSSSRNRIREFRSALKLELRRAGRPEADVEGPPAPMESATLARAAAVSQKLGEINVLVQRLEALVGLRGETSAAQSHFEVVMESVAEDCKWVDRALQAASASAKAQRGQRRDFESRIAATLRKQLEDMAKKVQACADLRQKTLQGQQQRRHRLSHAGPAISAKVQLDTPLFSSTSFAAPPAAQPCGLRSRRPAAAPSSHSRLKLDQQRQQQQLLLEQTSRRRLDHAHTIEAEIGKLGELFSRFSSLVAQQAEVVERLDDDVENARAEVDQGHHELNTAQAIIKGNRSLLIKIFALIVVFIILFLRPR